ncbi:hypothetical protein CA85_48280 [Allorhodopirellula solitaria]|uniref:Uncharacterized protein n=1 Tax=Allorhodopirellula solitaria TaxID=2527987 RepID=A0A5C5WYQ8_9BACT|nr:hypothetical protein CA85_48280 [Allorhodopirellula solitaria]
MGEGTRTSHPLEALPRREFKAHPTEACARGFQGMAPVSKD